MARAAFSMPEPLEDRRLMSSYFVTTAADSGVGSLRQAILNANANPGADTILFNLPPSGVQMIAPASPLPSITDAVLIDATSQSGYAGSPVVELSGTSAGAGADGLFIAADNSAVKGLSVVGFGGAGIVLAGNADSVAQSYLGVDPSGAADGNTEGVLVSGSNNIIGGAGAVNVISGNNDSGVSITGGDSNQILGNFIGTDPTGNLAVGNVNSGVSVSDASNVSIVGNVISGNEGDGVLLSVSGATIQNNKIGTDVTGEFAVPNFGNGVTISGSSSVTVGGTAAGNGNVISGNFGNGVSITRSSGTTLQGNLIGTDAAGEAAFDSFGNSLGNGGNGVTLRLDAAGTVIGGATAAARNVISGNSGDGIFVNTGDPETTTIQGNFVGTDVTGTAAVGNFGEGVEIASVGSSLGGTAAVVGNVMSGNFGDGLLLEDTALVQRNLIGTQADGVSPLGNDFNGVFVSGASGAMIGGTAAGDANVIAFNAAAGVSVTFGVNNAIRGNSIYGNAGLGIDLGGDGLTANDSAGHNGGNNFQDFPVLTAVTALSGGMKVDGTLSTGTAGTYEVDLYASTTADPSGNGEGQTYLGSVLVTTDASGNASFSTTVATPPSGQLVISATATDAAGNTSEFATNAFLQGGQTSSPDATSTTLSASVNPSVFGQPVTITVAVLDTAGPGVPSGTVTLLDGSTVIGAASLDPSGHAFFTGIALGVGDHTLTAEYSGNSAFVASTSAAFTETVNRDAVNFGFSSSMVGTVFGQTVTFTAGVSAAAPGAGTPTGTITFMDGSTALATVTLAADGTASFSTFALGVGGHTITAVYGGDANFFNNSAAVAQTVVTDATTTTLSSSANPSKLAQGVTFTATVTPNPDAGTAFFSPSGTVTFFDGNTALGTGTLANGVATLTLASLPAGGHTITATYSGDTDFGGSTSAPLAQSVNKGSTTTTLSSSLNPVVFGQSVTFTATVATLAAGFVPSGSVDFLDNGLKIGSGDLLNGVATFTTAGVAVGGHTITASYSGDANFNAGSPATLAQSVAKDNTSTGLVSSLNPSKFGQLVTLTADVSANAPGGGTLTGSISFMEGSLVLDTEPLVAGQAHFTTSALSVADHVLTAVYSGDVNFNTSASAPLIQHVNQNATATTVTSSASPSVFGQAVAFTAHVSPGDAGLSTPTGIVTFEDGSTVIGTAALDGNGNAVLTTSSLAVGGHTITAVYAGSTNYTGSSAALEQTVQPRLGSISGTVYQATTGNGLTADDTPMAGVTVSLYLDRDHNGVLNAHDGAPVATVTTGADGAYVFSGLSAGTYFVQETTPTGYNQTAPAKYYTVTLAAGDIVSSDDFDNALLPVHGPKKSKP